MARMVIIGGGLAGLSAALFAARRGHRVVLIERDQTGPRGGPDEIFECWHRPGVPQCRHSHKFLGRSTRILLDEAPELVAELVDLGVRKVSISRFDADREDPEEYALAARRLVYEAVLRRAVRRQTGVELITGQRPARLDTQRRDGVPTVTSVVLDDGRRMATDLVVDAGGRHSALLRRMLSAPLPAAAVQQCGFVYLTRHYRLLPGRQLPPMDRPLALNLGYAAALAFPADNGTFSLSLTFATSDPLRHALREPETWDRFVAAVPHTARWACRGAPRGRVHAMSGIENRWQRLTTQDGPVVGGAIAIGDAAVQTNPTYGRGVSMAMVHARHLAMAAERVPTDPVGFVQEFDDWTATHLGVWFRTQIAADTAGVAKIEAGVRGHQLAASSDPFARLMAGIEALAASDEVVSRRLGRMAHLLITPAELLADREVVQRVTAYLGKRDPTEEPVEGPSRAEFESIVAS